MIEILKNDYAKNALMALNHNLYHNVNWGLKSSLENPQKNDFVILALNDKIPVGVIFGKYYRHYDSYGLSIYVKPEYRRMGIGTLLINESKKMVNKELIGYPGIEESGAFYKKQINVTKYGSWAS